MFTGLVETTGFVTALQSRQQGAVRLLIHAPALEGRWHKGDSIAVNGVCLTAIPQPSPDDFGADLAAETVQRTTLAQLAEGALVNLELPTPAGSPLGGHVVQGHVDGVGKLVSLAALGSDPATSDWRLTVLLPPELAQQVIPQGSITLDGISLTVAKLYEPDDTGAALVEVAIIPHTYAATHLHTLGEGSLINIEADVLSKYARQANRAWLPVAREVQGEWLTGEYLMANGY